MTAKQASLLRVVRETKFDIEREGRSVNQHTLYSLFYRRWVYRERRRVVLTEEGAEALRSAWKVARSEGVLGQELTRRVAKAAHIRGLALEMRRSA